MLSRFQITVINADPKGNFWKEPLPLNDALLKLMQFARKNPQSICTIELREVEPTQQLPPVRKASIKTPDGRLDSLQQPLPAEQAIAEARRPRATVAHLKPRPLSKPGDEAAEAVVDRYPTAVRAV